MAKSKITRGRKKAGTERRGKAAGGAKVTNWSMSAYSTQAIQAELSRRRALLASQRANLDAEIATIDQMLGNASASSPKAAVTRKAPAQPKMGKAGAEAAKRQTSGRITLPDAITTVLDGKEMAIPDIMQAVKKAGYKSKSANFRTMVSITLSQNDRFKRVARGVYALAE